MTKSGISSRKKNREYRKGKLRAPVVIAGSLSSLALAAALGFWVSNNATTPNPVVEKPTIEESLRLEGRVVAFHAAKHAAHQSSLSALQASNTTATSNVVSPELAEWKGRKVNIAGTLESGQSIFAALSARKVNTNSIQEVVIATNTEFNFRKRARPGDKWFASVDEKGKITSFRYQKSLEHIWETKPNEKGQYEATKIVVDVDRRIRIANGKIESSLWKALADSSAGSEFVTDFIDLFAYKIDFGTQTKAGDEFSLVFEEIFLDGKFLRFGEVLAAYYRDHNNQETFAFRFDQDGEVAYFDEKGASLKGQFLKSPIADARVTSTFGKRFHPVLKKMKVHQGVDYGAPTGTPVQAIAAGTVLHAGWRGSNGKIVSIRHSNGYITHYAHLSKIKSGLHAGSKVTQKTVIGKVGSTGRSTGPHLHLGMTKNGRYVNPLKIKEVKGESVPTKTLEAYKKTVVLPMMKQLRNATNSDPDG